MSIGEISIPFKTRRCPACLHGWWLHFLNYWMHLSPVDFCEHTGKRIYEEKANER